MLGLLFRKNTILALAIAGAFTYPMVQNGELSLSTLTGVFGESEVPNETPYDPYQGAPSPYASTFRPAVIGSQQNNQLPGSQGNLSALPASSSQPPQPATGNSVGNQIGQFLGSLFETQQVDASGQTIPQGPPQVPAQTASSGNQQPPMVPIDTMPVIDIREIIRFDVSPYWVQQRWPRVSAAPVSEEGYQGLRVPLTASGGPLQLSGALTYYFDEKQTVQRIQFLGTTQQPAVIEQLCLQYFQFKKIEDMPGVLAPIHDGQPRGLLKFSLPVVLDRNRSMDTKVALEINSTRGTYQLSPLMRQIALQ